jgi:hypothetical protein
MSLSQIINPTIEFSPYDRPQLLQNPEVLFLS